MSRISQDFINSVGYLYEEINIQQEDFLNEESQYYDAEATELVEDILSTISSMMVYEGYSAEGIIGFLADSSEETIIEKYLNFDESILTESAISEDYIVEQLEIFDVAINEGLGTLIGKVAKGALGLAGRVASKPARMAVAKKMMQSKDPAKTAAAVDRLARMKLNKAGAPSDFTKKFVDAAPDVATKTRIAATAPAVGKIVKGVQKVKDIAKGAKAALPGIAKGALLGGAGVLTGYVGAKMGGAGQKPTESPKPSPSSKYNAAAALGGKAAFSAGGGLAKMKQNPNMTAADVQKQGMINIRNKKPPVAAPKPSPAEAPASTPPAAQKPQPKPQPKPEKKPSTGKLGDTTFERRTPTSAELRGAQEYRQQNPNAKPEDVLKAAQDAGKKQTSVDKDLAKFNKSDELNKPAPAGTALAAEQERRRKKVEQDLKNAASSMKESYEPYEVLLEYLMSGGHADTIEEAHYIMLEMDASAVRAVMEEYEDYLLAEEVSEWVDGLLNEGHDLSEYSWDDIVEYYVNEANRGDEHVTSSMYMSREPETKEAKVRRRQIRDGLPDNASHQGPDKDHDRQWAHEVSRGRKKLKPISHDTLAKVKDKNPSGKYAAMQRRKKQGLG